MLKGVGWLASYACVGDSWDEFDPADLDPLMLADNLASDKLDAAECGIRRLRDLMARYDGRAA